MFLFYFICLPVLFLKFVQFILSSRKVRPNRSHHLIILLCLTKYFKGAVNSKSFLDCPQKMLFLLYQIQVECIFKGEKFVIGDHHQTSDHFCLRNGVQNEIMQIVGLQLFFSLDLILLFKIGVVLLLQNLALWNVLIEQLLRRFFFIIDAAGLTRGQFN